MEWHIKQAIDDAASQDEILEAVEVGIEMSGGPGTVAARFAMNVLEYYKK
jgi:alkylhydroperoxidase/carboxymuconolactone decarboxylase family protein YurZ